MINANWTTESDGDDGSFAFSIVTEDEERHVIRPSAQPAAAVLGLTQASPVLLWDPEARTLIPAPLGHPCRAPVQTGQVVDPRQLDRSRTRELLVNTDLMPSFTLMEPEQRVIRHKNVYSPAKMGTTACANSS